VAKRAVVVSGRIEISSSLAWFRQRMSSDSFCQRIAVSRSRENVCANRRRRDSSIELTSASARVSSAPLCMIRALILVELRQPHADFNIATVHEFKVASPSPRDIQKMGNKIHCSLWTASRSLATSLGNQQFCDCTTINVRVGPFERGLAF